MLRKIFILGLVPLLSVLLLSACSPAGEQIPVEEETVNPNVPDTGEVEGDSTLGVESKPIPLEEAEKFFPSNGEPTDGRFVIVSPTEAVIFVGGTTDCPAQITQVLEVENQLQIMSTTGETECSGNFAISAFSLEAYSNDFNFNNKQVIHCIEIACRELQES